MPAFAPRQHPQLFRFPAAQADCKAPGGTADSKSASGLALNFLATEPGGVGANEVHVTIGLIKLHVHKRTIIWLDQT